jgi:hypothetical protein
MSSGKFFASLCILGRWAARSGVAVAVARVGDPWLQPRARLPSSPADRARRIAGGFLS